MKKLFSLLLIGLLLIGSISFATDVIDEKWGKPTYVYGAGLSESQVQETAQLLKISHLDNVHPVRIMAEDMRRYIGGDPVDSSLFSSALVTKKNDGYGLHITVLTPENITQITPEQYQNAAITAGVKDVDISIGSIFQVTGESALTGIYKAFEVNGEELDSERMQVGQDELETVNQINQENADNEEFDSARFDQVMIEIKQALADLKERTGQLATREDIEQIINDALAKYNMQSIINNVQINNLLVFFEKYQQSGVLDASEVKQQLKQLSDQVSDRVRDLVDQAQASGLLDQIAQFFRELFQSIADFFRNLG